MKFPKLFKKTKKSANILALDIGTQFVKALVFKIEEGHIVPLGLGKARQQSDAMNGAMITDMQNVLENCDLAIGSAVESFNNKSDLPTSVVLGVAGELVQGSVILANYERENKDTKITKKEVDEVIANVRTNSFIEAKLEIAENLGQDPKSLEEINTLINDIYIDGFRVNSPVGFTGESLTFRLFTTFAPSAHINTLKNIAKTLDLEVRSIIVEPYAIARSYSNSKTEGFSGIFIDIGAGTTDIAVVQNGVVLGTKMFAFGGKLFTKRIASLLEIDTNKAEVKKLAYTNGELNGAEKIKIQKILEKDAKLWASGVCVALSDFEDCEVYPQNIYLCGGGSRLPEMKKSLMEYPWLNELPFDRFPKTDYINPNNISDVATNDFIKEVDDVAVASLARVFMEVDNYA